LKDATVKPNKPKVNVQQATIKRRLAAPILKRPVRSMRVCRAVIDAQN